MLSNVLFMLLGAALVAIGVLATALADRIRGLRVSREAAPRERVSRAQSSAQSTPTVIPVDEMPEPPAVKPRVPRPAPLPKTEGGEDVIAALVASGYKRPIATEATWACTMADRVTIELWTASALRRCARGGMS